MNLPDQYVQSGGPSVVFYETPEKLLHVEIYPSNEISRMVSAMNEKSKSRFKILGAFRGCNNSFLEKCVQYSGKKLVSTPTKDELLALLLYEGKL